MKKQNLIIFIPSLIILLVLVVFANSCKKDEENNTVTPVLLTIEVTAITQTTANCGGNITSDGGANVTARGVCWSTGQTPTVSDNKTTDGTGTGSFTSIISGLSANTTYYVRAYATNSNGTSYGNTCTFTTHINTPTVSTKDVTDISHSTAVSGGIISFEGETTITARGVCWSTEQAPTISDNKTIDGVGIGEFSTNLTGLSPGVNYFVRAYAEYNDTCIYGNEKTFNTLDLTEPIVSTKQISNIRGLLLIKSMFIIT